MSGTSLAVVPALVAWAGVAYKLPALWRHPRDPMVRAFWLSVFFFALALTTLIPPVALWIDQMTGVANLSRLLGNSVVMMSACATLAFHYLHLEDEIETLRRRIRRAMAILVGTVLAMIGVFVLAPVHREAGNFWGRYGGAPGMLEYHLLYLSYLGLVAYYLVPSVWHYARLADRPILSLGLRLNSIGVLCGSAYIVHEGLRALADAFQLGNPFLDSDAVTRLLIIACAALTLTGSTLPAWGSRIGLPDALDWLERYRIYWRLYPLWLDLYRVDPDIALFPPRSLVRDALTLRDLRFRLYRRMVEIQDGILVLRPFIDPWVIERARELGREAHRRDHEIEAVVAAASIAAALQTRRRGGIADPDVSALPAWGGDDVPSEAAALALVARFYRRSPIVRTILKQLKERDPSGTPPVETPEGTR